MALSLITPVASSVILAGDGISFSVADTYSSLIITITAVAGDEVAYNSATGAGAGYSVTVANAASVDTFTVTRDVGWDLEPQVINVAVVDGGAYAEEWSYYLGTQRRYPQNSEPLNPVYVGTLIITEDNVQVRDDVGWIEFDPATFNVADSGSGKVTVTGVGGGGSGDVVGPASAVDDNVAVYDSTTGKLIKDGGQTIAQILAGATDADAIHDNVAAEFSPLTGKSNPVDADLLLLEDSADSFNKKKLLLSNLLATLSTQQGFGIWQYTGDADTTPASGGFSFDTSGIGIADHIYVHENNASGMDMALVLGSLKVDDIIYLGHSSLKTVGSMHKLTGTPTLTANVWDIPIDGATSGETSSPSWVLNDFAYFVVLTADTGGDVVGPASATDDAIVVYDGTTGKLVKNSTGTIAQITANTAKVTNATHTGDVTGSTALTIGAKKVTLGMLADGTDGELITWSATGVATTVPVGTATHVLTSNGPGAAPTFQAGGGSGDVVGPGASVLSNAIASYDGTGGLTIKESNVLVGAGSVGTGTRTLGANSTLSGGFLASAGSSIVSSGNGSIALGYATGTASVNATGIGSISLGYCSQSISGTAANITNSGLGSLVIGATAQTVSGTASLNCSTAGAFVGGYASQGGLVEAVSASNGCCATGYADGTGSIIRVTGALGGFASGSAQAGGTIITSGKGAFASGAADIQSGGTAGTIAASGLGSFAGGSALGAVAGGTAQITASGSGSFAWGSVLAVGVTSAIAATATNAVQFGIGTNAVADSLQVGDTTNGLRLLAKGTTSTTVGSFWTDGTDVFCRTGGVTKNLTNI